MKLLFVYSAKFKKDNEGNLYTDGSINEELWRRYTNIADCIEIISRLEKNEYTRECANVRFNNFDSSNKNLVQVPDLFSSISSFLNLKKRNQFNKIIEKKVVENDYIIVRLPSIEGYLAVKYAKKYNKPYLVEIVGCPKDALWNHSFKGKIITIPNYIAMKKAVINAPYALYVTDQFLQSRYPCNGNKIGCSDVILSKVDNSVLENRLIKIENMNENNPIILGTTAAIDVRYKGQEYVIKAIAKLNKQGYNFEYHLAGAGDKSNLKSVSEKCGISNKVKFLGTLPHEKVFDYLDKIDIYIQPSMLEGLPRALVEAMSRGCPSLGSRVGGIPELLNEKFLFSNGFIDQICGQLKMLDKNTMLEEAQRGFNKAKEFDKKVLDDKRNNFYRKLVE